MRALRSTQIFPFARTKDKTKETAKPWIKYDPESDDVFVAKIDDDERNRKNKNVFSRVLVKAKTRDDDDEDDDDGIRGSDGEDVSLLKTPHGLLLRPDPHRPSLLFWDLLFFLLDFLQIYSLLQSMSLRWIWPQSWLQLTAWVFVFNLDIWDLVKFYSPDLFQNARDFVPLSKFFPFHYAVWVVLWVIVFVLIILFVVVGKRLTKKRRVVLPYLKQAEIERIAILLIQALCLPLGAALARLFHCRPEGIIDIANEGACWTAPHFLSIVPALFIFLFVFVFVPVRMIHVIRLQVHAHSSEDHELFIRLKETEFASGVDVLWATARLYLFSSFRRPGVFFRPALIFLKLVLVVAFAAFFNNLFEQAVLCCVSLLAASIACAVLRPHRVPLFNLLLFLNFFFLSMDALIGALLHKFGTFNNYSAMFTPAYAFYELLVVNLFWLLLAAPLVGYVFARRYRLCRVDRAPLWPALTAERLDDMDEATRNYTKEVIKARLILDRSLSMPSTFVPVHELAREIQIINAFCRESELQQHPMQKTLWDVLDDLIESHNQARRTSLFAGSVKPSIRKTAGKFLQMMPAFARRLHRRDRDFILVMTTRKRLLLKLYVLAVFLDLLEKVCGRRRRKALAAAAAREKGGKGKGKAIDFLTIIESPGRSGESDA